MTTDTPTTHESKHAYICTGCGHEQAACFKGCEKCGERRMIAQSVALMMYGNGYRELFKDKSKVSN
jgi:predicted ATP-dependent serine protease